MLVDQTMPPDDRALFLRLHNCKSADPADYRGIVDTNSLPVPSLPGHALEHHAVCAAASRINHRYASTFLVSHTHTHSLSVPSL